MKIFLLLHDLQDLHGAGLDADTAGNALGGGANLGLHHNMHGADLDALAAGGAELLIDHEHTGLGILGDGAGFAGLCTLAALDAGHGLGLLVLVDDLDAGKIRIKGFIESIGTGTDALQASHALCSLFNRQLLHM